MAGKTNNSQFWQKRLQANGHTGWADPLIYALDQSMRLKMVELTVKKLDIKPGAAMDFGCGTGDFSRVLIGRDFNVIGYDPFVQPKLSSTRFTYAASYDDIQAEDESLQLVLSVTALDHILNHSEFINALTFINTKLHIGGKLIAIEYALAAGGERKVDPRTRSSYQAFRTVSVIKQSLQETGFRIEEIHNVYHPIACPSPEYIKLRKSFPARVRSRIEGGRGLGRLLDAWLVRKAAAAFKAGSPSPYSEHDSPLKLFVCSKA